MENGIKNGAVKIVEPLKITKGFTSKPLTEADKVSPTNITLVRAPYGGDYPKFDEHSWEGVAKLTIAGCRSKKDDEQEYEGKYDFKK